MWEPDNEDVIVFSYILVIVSGAGKDVGEV